jgi:fatty acid desaturase
MTIKPKGLGPIRDLAVEFDTLFLAIVIYGGWLGITLLHRMIHPALLFVLGGWFVAWHGSLQHETIHGHPTLWPRVNNLIAMPPLSLWLPYGRYRDTHQAHHACERLTEPELDPESRYLKPNKSRQGAVDRGLARAHSSLLGRLTLGPPVEIGAFLLGEARHLANGAPGVRRAWAEHLVAAAGVVAWLVVVCKMSLGTYLLTFIYPGCALSLLRSFAEHRADPVGAARIAIVEKAPAFGLLFLNNNLHAVHHRFPGASWRRLPQLHAQNRRSFEGPDALVYDGYAEVFTRFLLRPHDRLVHPALASPASPAV